MNSTTYILAAVVIALIVGAFALSSGSKEAYNEGVVYAEDHAHVLGNPDASVVLEEYSDLQCPACAAHVPAVKEALALYGDNLRFEYKHFPLISIHPQALPAAKAAEAAGQQGMFFEYHDALFERQAEWSNNASAANRIFEEIATDLGLDVEVFNRHLKSQLVKEYIEADFAEARERNITSTPTFFLNGEQMQYQTFEDFIDQIAAATGNGVSTELDGVDAADLNPATSSVPVGEETEASTTDPKANQ